MATWQDQEAADDLVFYALLLTALYVGVRYWRGQLAAASGWGFTPYAPAPESYGGQILSLLVPMQISAEGIAFIKKNETFQPRRYWDKNGWAIGYGHHIQPGENIVEPITPAEADSLLQADLAPINQGLAQALKVQVSQSQFDALGDWAYNVGLPAALKSTLMRLLNGGDYAGAAQQFSLWVHSGGQISPVLQARRQQDQQLFNS